MPRPITVRLHDNGLDRWCMANAPPAPGLAGAITGYCHYTEHTTSFTARREMPNTAGVMIINLGGVLNLVGGDGAPLRLGPGEGFVGGLHQRPAISSAEGGAQSGIHIFLPLPTLGRLLRLDMDQLVDRVVDMRTLFGPAATMLGSQLIGASPQQCFSLLDAALAERLATAPPPDRTTAWALARLHADPAVSIADLARTIGWSRQTLSLRIRQATGAPPRLYARLRRFERLLANLRHATKPHWADLAALHGFADQPHMARELRDLAGLTPTALYQRLLPDGGGFRDR